MTRFDDLAAFAAVVRVGSFTRAAAQMGLSPSALSQTVKALESRLDMKLLNRTTRSVSTTEAGERLYQAVGPRFADIEGELQILSELRGKPAGQVRITGTENAISTVVWPKLEPWLPRYPEIQLEISSDNRFVDIVAERFDIGVRLGNDVAKDMIAVRIAPDMRMVVVGAPAYFAKRPPPAKPQDLQAHDCIGRRLPTHSGLLSWEFHEGGKSFNISVSGRLAFNANQLIVAAALGGHGLAWVRHDQVDHHLADGSLVSVLDAWSSTYSGYHLYYATRRSSPALALVVDALRYETGSR
ncbi:DNA-binding transcriptional regulator, LysR family [Rhodoferax sp. OV413]|uniref:LysR family transcriptional regulator n=1 Tax=Rhodoferax sp. OV413 TaxID=1855285 RepID=UPI00088D56F7|nr:LysR family transcriptional regulator [Rhodoferax sp. OV413]SDO74318.1 DNA-binding transcriptional regulator, LysR family [Rhodoferax sp. OV413]